MVVTVLVTPFKLSFYYFFFQFQKRQFGNHKNLNFEKKKQSCLVLPGNHRHNPTEKQFRTKNYSTFFWLPGTFSVSESSDLKVAKSLYLRMNLVVRMSLTLKYIAIIWGLFQLCCNNVDISDYAALPDFLIILNVNYEAGIMRAFRSFFIYKTVVEGMISDVMLFFKRSRCTRFYYRKPQI